MVRKLPQVISQEEFEKLLNYVLRQKKKNSKTYALAMLLGFEAGMRISEIVGWKEHIPALTKDKINFEQNTIRIDSGKGQKDRVVPLPKRVGNNALNLLPIKLTRRSLQLYVTNLGKKILGKHITFHTLRHGFATHYYNNTQDIRGLQVLLGHSRLDTTSIYAHVNPKQIIEKAREIF